MGSWSLDVLRVHTDGLQLSDDGAAIKKMKLGGSTMVSGKKNENCSGTVFIKFPLEPVFGRC